MVWIIYVIFALSLVAVTKGADWLVEGAVSLTDLMGISQIVVGATIVSLGTTLPETLISSFAAFQGKGDVIVGVALGSILFNSAVILGLAVVIRPPRLDSPEPFSQAGIMFGVLTLFRVLAFDLQISRAKSLLLALILIPFLGLNTWRGLQRNIRESLELDKRGITLCLLKLTLGCVLVVVGAHYLLDSGLDLARLLGVPEAIIALTLFAIGSSLPELITAVTAAAKGHTDLILGNILGANTLNIIFVISTAGLIRPFAINPDALKVIIPFALSILGLLFIPAVFLRKISRLQGMLALAAYLVYLVFFM